MLQDRHEPAVIGVHGTGQQKLQHQIQLMPSHVVSHTILEGCTRLFLEIQVLFPLILVDICLQC